MSDRYFLVSEEGWRFTNNHLRPNSPISSLPIKGKQSALIVSEEGVRVYTEEELPLHVAPLMYELENQGKVTRDEYGAKLHRFVITERLHLDEVFVRFYAVQLFATASSHLKDLPPIGLSPWYWVIGDLRMDFTGYTMHDAFQMYNREAWRRFHSSEMTREQRAMLGCVGVLTDRKRDPWLVTRDVVRYLGWIDQKYSKLASDLLFRCSRCCG